MTWPNIYAGTRAISTANRRSEVDCAGSVPEGWRVRRLKRVGVEVADIFQEVAK